MKLRLLLALIVAASLNESADAALRTVALTGQQAPGAAAGANFTQLHSTTSTAAGPVINNTGRVAFAGEAMVTAGATSTGIWSEVSGTLAAVARSGTQAPGSPAGTNYATFNNPVLNEAGRSSFIATVSGAAATNVGLWTEGEGGLALIARKGSAAPGGGVGANFLTLFEPSVNDSGQTAFRGQMSGTGVTTANDDGIWAVKAGMLTLMARAGSQAPGVPAGVNYDRFPQPPILINSAGQIAFSGFLNGAGVTTANDMGIWVERGGALTLVAREGNAVPRIAGATFSFIGDPVLNRNGQTAFSGLMAGVPGSTNGAVFSEGVGTLAVAARKGDAAPGTAAGVKFNNFGSPLLNGDAQVAFFANLSGSGVTTSNDLGIWSQRGGMLNLVARRGEQAPGVLAGLNFNSFSDPAFNSASQVAFTAALTGDGVTTSNDGGIWAQGLGGDLRLVAREGDLLEISPGVTRTIATLSFTSGAPTEDGRRSGFNDFGEAAFFASFTDGSSGIFVSDAAKSSPGDFDGDGDCDGADFLTWQQGLGRVGTGLPNNGDANADGNVDAADLAVWQSKFGAAPAMATAVPEPGAMMLAAIAAAGVCRWRRFS